MNMRSTLVPTLLAAAIALACADVHAQAADQGQSSNTTTTLSEVLVTTGTRAPDRTAADSLAPIDVLTPADIKATGVTDLTRALRVLLPSINFVQASNVDQGDADQPAQLRGLSPDHTLVLINGKRQHSSSVLHLGGVSYDDGSTGTDLSAIPLNAIERIEVLRDGAAAQYGSDAIAGVINIILKGGSKGGAISVTHGLYNKGDGSTWQGSADGGFSLGDKGWMHLSVTDRHQDPTNRAGPDMRFPGDPTYGKVTFHSGVPLTGVKQAALNMQYDLAPAAQLYGFAIYNQRKVTNGAYFRSLSTYKDAHPEAVAVYPEGFLPTEHSSLFDNSAVLGVRGTVAGWHYDVSANTGGNHWKFRSTNTFNYSLGDASPTAFYLGTTSNRQNVVTADFSRDFQPGFLRNPLTVAWGLEYRDEEYTLKHGDATSYFGSGSQGFGGYQPIDAGKHSRQNKAAYLDLNTDFTDKLTAEFAARHEHYSDFGNTTPWKLSGRYAITPALAVRSTISTGFRAPSLAQEYYSSTSTSSMIDPHTGILGLFNTRHFPANDPVAEALGSRPLKAEQSRNYSVGIVYSAPSGLNVTLDLYQIRINDRIALSGSLDGDEVAEYLASVGFPFVTGGSFFTNAVNTRTRGLDLVAGYPFNLGDAGALKLTGGVNYGFTTILSVKPNPPQLGLHGLTLDVFTAQSRNFLTTQTPKSKAFVAGDWSRGSWSAHAQLTRYGKYIIGASSITAVTQYPPARYLLDVSASYTHGPWVFTLGSDNVTNTYPQKNVPLNAFAGNFVYPDSSPFSYQGAYYYGTVTFHW